MCTNLCLSKRKAIKDNDADCSFYSECTEQNQPMATYCTKAHYAGNITFTYKLNHNSTVAQDYLVLSVKTLGDFKKKKHC